MAYLRHPAHARRYFRIVPEDERLPSSHVDLRSRVKRSPNTADQLRAAIQMKMSHLGHLPASVRLVSCIRSLDACAFPFVHPHQLASANQVSHDRPTTSCSQKRPAPHSCPRHAWSVRRGLARPLRYSVTWRARAVTRRTTPSDTATSCPAPGPSRAVTPRRRGGAALDPIKVVSTRRGTALGLRVFAARQPASRAQLTQGLPFRLAWPLPSWPWQGDSKPEARA